MPQVLLGSSPSAVSPHVRLRWVVRVNSTFHRRFVVTTARECELASESKVLPAVEVIDTFLVRDIAVVLEGRMSFCPLQLSAAIYYNLT